MTSGIDYDTIARDAERHADMKLEDVERELDGLAPTEVQTTGPVIIDTVNHTVRNAETGQALMSLAPPVDDEREIDLVYVFAALWTVGFILSLLAIVTAPFSLSQKLVLSSLVFIVVGERLWREIRRLTPTTEPEGILYASQRGINYRNDQHADDI